MDKTYKRECPCCGKMLYYSRDTGYYDAKRKRSLCGECGNSNPITKIKRSKSHKGIVSGFKGKYHSLQSKEKMSNWHKQKIVSLDTKKKLSLRNITQKTKDKMSLSTTKHWQDPIVRERMVRGSKWINTKVDKGQLELLEKWNRLGFNFIPNYQVKKETNLFYVDGYDNKHNVVLEYDSSYHNHNQQSKKDLIRQQKIIDILKPKKFWRYNAKTKHFKDILKS